jgi:hypothetical protein
VCGATGDSVSHGTLQEFCERFAEREDFSEVTWREIGASRSGASTFAADLNDSDDFVARQNRRADDFLNGRSAFAGALYAFKYRGVSDAGKIVDNFWAAFASGARGQPICWSAEPGRYSSAPQAR